MNGVTRKNINCLMPNNMKQIKAHIAVSLDGFTIVVFDRVRENTTMVALME